MHHNSKSIKTQITVNHYRTQQLHAQYADCVIAKQCSRGLRATEISQMFICTILQILPVLFPVEVTVQPHLIPVHPCLPATLKSAHQAELHNSQRFPISKYLLIKSHLIKHLHSGLNEECFSLFIDFYNLHAVEQMVQAH